MLHVLYDNGRYHVAIVSLSVLYKENHQQDELCLLGPDMLSYHSQILCIALLSLTT